MPKLNLTKKSVRVIEFLSGIAKPDVARAMLGVGFKAKDAQEGYRRLEKILEGRLDYVFPVEVDPKIVTRLDGWENRWFEVAEVTLKYNYPAAHEHVFRNLVQAQGSEVIATVGTFLRRLDTMVEEGVDGAEAALALLAERGLDRARLDEARALLAELTVEPAPRPENPVSDEAMAQREATLWDWYKEWSVIARRGIRNKNILRALGFRKDGTDAALDEPDEPPASGSGSSGEPDDGDEG